MTSLSFCLAQAYFMHKESLGLFRLKDPRYPHVFEFKLGPKSRWQWGRGGDKGPHHTTVPDCQFSNLRVQKVLGQLSIFHGTIPREIGGDSLLGKTQ